MRRIAIIPARGGSKRIPHKNIKNFYGKPMISYPIEALIKSNLFDNIHVSTNDREIAEVVEKQGLKIDFYRPNELSDDHTPIMPVIRYVIEEYIKLKKNYDEVWVILPCSPMLDYKDLISASIIFKESKSSNLLMSVAEYPVPIEWAYKIKKNGDLQPVKKEKFSIRSQDIKRKFHDAGMFYIYSKDLVLNSQKDEIDQSIVPYFIKKGRSIDIDNIEDWKFAEKLYKIF